MPQGTKFEKGKEVKQVKVKYVVILWDGTKLVNRFFFPVYEKAEAIALFKNLVLRYGERNVEVISHDSDDDHIAYNLTEKWLSK